MNTSPHKKLQGFLKAVETQVAAGEEHVHAPSSPLPRSGKINPTVKKSHQKKNKGLSVLPHMSMTTSITLFFFLICISIVVAVACASIFFYHKADDEHIHKSIDLENRFRKVFEEQFLSFDMISSSFSSISAPKEGVISQRIFMDIAETYFNRQGATDQMILMTPTTDEEKAFFEGQTFSESVPTYQPENSHQVYYFPIRYRFLNQESPLYEHNAPLSQAIASGAEMNHTLFEAITSGQTVVSPLFKDQGGWGRFSGKIPASGLEESHYFWMMRALYAPSPSGKEKNLKGVLAVRVNIDSIFPSDEIPEGHMITFGNSGGLPYANTRLAVQMYSPHSKVPTVSFWSMRQDVSRYESQVNLGGTNFIFTIWGEDATSMSFWFYALSGGGLGLLFIVVSTIDFLTLHRIAKRVDIDRNEADTLINRQRQELQAGERRFKHLVESTNVIPWTADLQSKCFTYIGPQIESITGYSATTWLTQGYWVHHVHPEDRQKVLYHFPEFQEGQVGVREYRVRKSDGTVLWVRNSIACADQIIKGNPLPPRLIQGFMVDITEQKLAQEELMRARDQQEQANRTKSEFLANMSHELRTPLNAIIGFAEIMKGEVFGAMGNPKYTEYTSSIYTSGKHLLDLINDILDLSKIEAGRFELQEEDIDVGDLMKSCHSLLAERARSAGLQLIFDLPDTLHVLYADSRRLKQIMINLLSNAIKFTKMGGIVRLVIKVSLQNGLYIAVSDTGIGIKPEDLPKVFEKFSQIDSTLSRQHEGTGLGLPIARSLIELHGGTLKLESVYEEGTTVSLWIPPERLRKQTTPNPLKAFSSKKQNLL